ncbi:acetyl-CoA acetyltransferase [Primorskyibacter flagellatus]|uniref:Acetyl-CoA acetyltransferase n=1 Tax=Primorskyibacter flagellatus TaxID=1387277 RepID=A0A917A4V2_9RHOB|nr:acetyl-CoA acetyltransferase [Primorskyibacter flagellatus]GGE27546.1 acetyl-CoA acetyltransferase [Primorskyibacter flagellatus]
MRDPERIPVIVGVGQIADRPDHWQDGLDSLGLMEAALRRADADAGGGWLSDLDTLATVDQISCPDLTTIADDLAARLGATRARTETTDMPHGDSPVRLLNEAANRIGAGEIRIAAIVGGESLRTSAARARAGDPGKRPGDILRGSPKRLANPFRAAHGLNAPTDMYPLYENATREAWGQTLAAGQGETGAIWSRMAKVAADTEGAWIRSAPDAEEIVTPSPANRPIAHPYTKFMVANASVNQGAGFIVTSLAEARRRGLPDSRTVHVGLGAAAKEPAELLDREGYTRSPSMQAVLTATLARNAVTAADLAHVELYSCFPCVPKMARRIIGWPEDRPVTVFGGLTFGGAPVANYMGHAIVCMTDRLRGTGTKGLVYGNGGIVTTNHAILLSGAPLADAVFPQDFDVQADADALRGPPPGVSDSHTGPVSVESWTVHYDRDGALLRGVIVARLPDGMRTLALVPPDDTATIAEMISGDALVGRAGRIDRKGDLRVFRFAAA